MHFNHSHIKQCALGPLCLALALFCGGRAAQAAGLEKAVKNLPDLPETNQPAPGHFWLDGQSASLGYHSRHQKWSAKLDEYSDIAPSLTVDYGMLFTNDFGAGAALTRQRDYSEVLLNGVYAPAPNLRFKLASGQLRASGDSSSASNAVSQSSYLLDVKRYWGKGRLLSDFGLAAYTVQASGPNYADISALANADRLDASGDIDSGVPGRLDGYMLHLGLRPTSRSRFEFKRATNHLRYSFGEGMQTEQFASNHLKYSQYFGACTRLQGRYSISPNAERLGLSLARNSWSVNISRALDNNGADTAIQIGYAIPLGKTSGSANECGGRLDKTRAFEPIVDAVIARPYQFPHEPLSRIDVATISDPLAE